MERSSLTAPRIAEAVATGLAGGALGAVSWSLVGLGLPAAVVGALNGAVGGARGTYRWRSASGILAFVLDSTWALVTTFAGLVAHLVAAAQGPRAGYVAALSRRRNRHVYVRGLQVRKCFAITLGNVVNGADERARTSDRRQQLITDHEDVHVWQARWFGPLFPVLYGGWMLLGGVCGALLWLRRRDQPFGKFVESYAYYVNPFEWWAYSRDGHWPPANKVADAGWTMPAATPFAELPKRRFGRGRPHPPTGPPNRF